MINVMGITTNRVLMYLKYFFFMAQKCAHKKIPVLIYVNKICDLPDQD